MEATPIIIIFSSLGLGLSSFFGFYLLFSGKWRSLANSLLALLLLVLTVRIGKAVLYNFTELPLAVRNLGLAANLAAGPLLYLYGRSLLTNNFTWERNTNWHLVPSVLYVLFCWYIPNGTREEIWIISYALILIQSYVYVALSFKTLYVQRNYATLPIRNWYSKLTIGLLVIWLVYGLIFMGILPYHIAGAISFTVLMIVLAFIGMNQGLVFKGEIPEKYKNSKLSWSAGRKNLILIKEVLQKERLYLQPDLTIDRLSEKVNLHPRMVSEIINRYEGENFVSLINKYRVAEAKRLLKDKQTNFKIAAVAYNSGFNSLSAFNMAFKNITSHTPSEYRSLT